MQLLLLLKAVELEALLYYVITFLGFLDPPPPLRQHVFSTKNKQKLAFSDPPCPPTSADLIYEWSPGLQKTVCLEVPLYAYSGTYAYLELYVGIYFSSY